ncbi:ammosamide/lymphostin RiPP family protein [Streptomyces sp. 71268]|uniref:ammosamide/lymphostin RiPP family protein n=1 Tax=Streptomyces sp. 71268 TaxID=3002640 RepID=UPI0023F83A94|nr:ammosamide/lymphostin RiPP family protein [Streptomyces sp. 71268]WEV29180.1 ammosamide/lymphostin RiPP family protein [Streptomyces sp. 71268]
MSDSEKVLDASTADVVEGAESATGEVDNAEELTPTAATEPTEAAQQDGLDDGLDDDLDDMEFMLDEIENRIAPLA